MSELESVAKYEVTPTWSGRTQCAAVFQLASFFQRQMTSIFNDSMTKTVSSSWSIGQIWTQMMWGHPWKTTKKIWSVEHGYVTEEKACFNINGIKKSF